MYIIQHCILFVKSQEAGIFRVLSVGLAPKKKQLSSNKQTTLLFIPMSGLSIEVADEEN